MEQSVDRQTQAIGQTQTLLDQQQKALGLAKIQTNTGVDALGIARHGQRAWVTASRFVMSAEPENGKPITVKIGLSNSGQSPALDLSPQYPFLSLWPQE